MGMVFGDIEQHNGLTLFLAMVFYAVEIYADFSGYTDIAGLSIKIPEAPGSLLIRYRRLW